MNLKAANGQTMKLLDYARLTGHVDLAVWNLAAFKVHRFMEIISFYRNYHFH